MAPASALLHGYSIEVTALNATTPEFYHLAGIVRFKVTGMILKTSNIPKP